VLFLYLCQPSSRLQAIVGDVTGRGQRGGRASGRFRDRADVPEALVRIVLDDVSGRTVEPSDDVADCDGQPASHLWKRRLEGSLNLTNFADQKTFL